jgi:hypothetical protein
VNCIFRVARAMNEVEFVLCVQTVWSSVEAVVYNANFHELAYKAVVYVN